MKRLIETLRCSGVDNVCCFNRNDHLQLLNIYLGSVDIC